MSETFVTYFICYTIVALIYAVLYLLRVHVYRRWGRCTWLSSLKLSSEFLFLFIAISIFKWIGIPDPWPMPLSVIVYLVTHYAIKAEDKPWLI